MNNQQYGQVVPFALPAQKLRRSAAERRRRGQPVEALELQRRAAWEGDAAADWLTLAEMLRAQSCWEQASSLLMRLLARDDAPPETWWELSRCLEMMGQRDTSVECLYHFLAEAPYAAHADDARMILAHLELDEERPGEARRLHALVRRGLKSWRLGDQEQGMRRLRRAIRLSRDPVRIHLTLTMLHMASQNFPAALQEISRALRRNPEHPRALCTLSVILYQQGRCRAARAVLRRCIPLCQGLEGEDMFLSAAWTIGATRETTEYLSQALRKTPNRIPLLHAQAWQYWELGKRSDAVRVWKHILRLDAEDCRAMLLLKYAPESMDDMMPVEAYLPHEIQSLLVRVLTEETQRMPAEELLRHGSPSRVRLDWCLTMVGEAQQLQLLKPLMKSEHPLLIRYLRELLMQPTTPPGVCQRVLMRLAELGQQQEMHMLVGNRISTVQCQRLENRRQLSLWRTFLPGLLFETRRWRCSPEITAFAADLWPMLPRRVRLMAASPLGYVCAKAVEVLYLTLAGRPEDAAQAMSRAPGFQRRIRRLVRCMAGVATRSPMLVGMMESEETDDEMH